MTVEPRTIRTLITAASFAVGSAAYLMNATPTTAQTQPKMSFFITSAGSGDGANLGGLSGADKICQTLATAAGAGDRTWHAYLSAAAANGQPAVNAKDRIGKGPWYNAKGAQVAASVADLHSDANKLGKDGSLTEKGAVVNGRGDTPNTHDILTGSNADGTLSGKADNTCGNWTKNNAGRGGSTARVGHHDRQGGGDAPTSWNSAHDTNACSQPDLVATGGAGLFYCFAIN
jgi:hypothetical protein